MEVRTTRSPAEARRIVAEIGMGSVKPREPVPGGLRRNQ